jgi:hypothetical protein
MREALGLILSTAKKLFFICLGFSKARVALYAFKEKKIFKQLSFLIAFEVSYLIYM